MIQSRAPMRLFNDCLDFESYIRSNTEHGLYKLDGKGLETVVAGETSNISQFCAFDCFEWVLFQHGTVLYLDVHFKFDRYLGPIIDIGLAMTMKISKENGQVLHRLTYQVPI